MDFKIDKKPKFKVTVYGREFECSRPTVNQVREYTVKVKSGSFDEIEDSKKFLASLGLDYDVLGEMEAEDYKDLIEFFINPKKK